MCFRKQSFSGDLAAYRTGNAVFTNHVVLHIAEAENDHIPGLTGGEALVTVGQFYLSEGSPARVVVPQEAAS